FSRGYPPSWIEKVNTRMGDKIAIAVRKIYKNRNLYVAENVRQFLPVIKTAFSLPNNIENEQDRIPKKTLNLLNEISANSTDRELKEEIFKIINFIKQKTRYKQSKPLPET